MEFEREANILFAKATEKGLDENVIFSEVEAEVQEKTGYQGTYYFAECGLIDGYTQGEATQEDIFIDAKKLLEKGYNIAITDDNENLCDEVCKILEEIYLEILSSKVNLE